jgi:hypothetical protein
LLPRKVRRRPMGNAFAHKARPQATAQDRGHAPPSLSAQTQRLVHDVLHSPGKPLGSETRADMEPRFRHDFSNVRVHADSNATALAINKPDDTFEREADRVAERVMRTSEPAGPVGIENEPVVRRKCACGGTCSECEAEQKVNLQRRAASTGESATVPPIVHDVLREPGRPLDAATRAFMEPRFGHDFSKVRVHADARAAESARAVSAMAYTRGTHIVFGTQQYAPHSSDGRHLLAHELVHTLQQRDTSALGAVIDPPHNRYENEADRIADLVVAGSAPPGAVELASTNSTIQRKCIAGGWQVDYDGCSLPALLADALSIDGNNPAGGKHTQFSNRDRTGACDHHDKCYQTCGSIKEICDLKFLADMLETCNRSVNNPDVKKKCADWALVYYAGVSSLGDVSYIEDQLEACTCDLLSQNSPVAPKKHERRRFSGSPADEPGETKLT